MIRHWYYIVQNCPTFNANMLNSNYVLLLCDFNIYNLSKNVLKLITFGFLTEKHSDTIMDSLVHNM